jgi:hypothetical protein
MRRCVRRGGGIGKNWAWFGFSAWFGIVFDAIDAEICSTAGIGHDRVCDSR